MEITHEILDLIPDVRRAFEDATWGSRNGTKSGRFEIMQGRWGQSKRVILFRELGLVFKDCPSNEDLSLSGAYIAEVVLDDVLHRVRLPYFTNVEDIEIQEYIEGINCLCDRSWCHHAELMVNATGCDDAHCGNWLIVEGNEVVLFDFDGICL